MKHMALMRRLVVFGTLIALPVCANAQGKPDVSVDDPLLKRNRSRMPAAGRSSCS